MLFTLDNMTLELLSPSGDGATAKRIRSVIAEQGEGLASLCFRTIDIGRMHRRLERLSLKPEPLGEAESQDAETGATLSWKRTRAATDATRGVRLFFLELDRERPLSVHTEVASITAMDHLVVATGDPERAAALYGARLGLDMRFDRSYPDWGRLMFFRCGDLIVEVVHRPGKDLNPARDRLWGLSWRVADADATRARLAAAGVEVSEVRTGRKPGTRVLTVRSSACGIPTLLVERTVEGMTSRHSGMMRRTRPQVRNCAPGESRTPCSMLCIARNDAFILNPRFLCHPHLHSRQAPTLAKAKRTLRWHRDPGHAIRILEAAKQEFAAHGLAGARVDRIAAKAGANKRMLYYHVGKKDDLYLAALEGAYEQIRAEERGLDLEHLDPPDAIERLIGSDLELFHPQPGIPGAAQHRKPRQGATFEAIDQGQIDAFAVRRDDPHRGETRRRKPRFRRRGRSGELYISIAALCFFYLSNSATLSVIFGRDLLKQEERDERLAHMVALVLAALTGKSTASFGKAKAPKLRAPARQPA